MNRKTLLKLMLLGILPFVQIACENAENAAIGNLIYINEASIAKTKEVTMQDEITRTSVTVRLAKAMGQDVTAELFLDEAALDAYNKKNETSYKLPEAKYVSFPEKITIAAGSVSADPVNIDIKSFETEGAQYAVPISIKEADGIAKAEGSSNFMVVLVKPLKQSVPKFHPYNAMQAAPEGSWGMSLPNYTLEWWSKMSAFSINNQAIFNSGGSTELYIRFGDKIYASGGRYVYNFLQIKTMGAQFDTGDPTAGNGLEANEWYHFAITYDADTGTSLMYKNGTQIASLVSATGQPMIIDKLQMLSSSEFSDACEICQVRLWKVTRSANQIKKGMYSEVEYTNKDLILYLPMNDGEGATTLRDVTGNGHDMEIGNLKPSSPNHADVTWETYTFALNN
ncbi:DUF1735 and LamG domain-containing protein [uncultured Bacteroides sp.]|uniref:DUF1735 and LamG domain-containing protein n=1 Tax=uncultured Bacteroides sp. TaxID=162156 RepID=UPI0025E01296|nr:DUF1735 and LamG domain-containing protein [uncultured Bacteroides sp.]